MNKDIPFRYKLLMLHYCASGDPAFVHRYLKIDRMLAKLAQISKATFISIYPKQVQKAEKVYDALQQLQIDHLLQDFHRNSIYFLTLEDKEYPYLLKEIHLPPPIVYLTQNQPDLNSLSMLSVVGTRHPSVYAKQTLEEILPFIVNEKIAIVSGLAAGIDALAHETALKNKGITFAVLAYGFYHVYPSHLLALKKEISLKYALISEYPPFVKPQKWQFPARNRIISGLSQGTLICEAKEKSGSLITADFALEQNREVFAFPARITDERGQGTNRLIQEGAKLVLHADDILNEIQIHH